MTGVQTCALPISFAIAGSPTRFGRISLRLEPLGRQRGWRIEFEREPGPAPASVVLPRGVTPVDPASRKWSATWAVKRLRERSRCRPGIKGIVTPFEVGNGQTGIPRIFPVPQTKFGSLNSRSFCQFAGKRNSGFRDRAVADDTGSCKTESADALIDHLRLAFPTLDDRRIQIDGGNLLVGATRSDLLHHFQVDLRQSSLGSDDTCFTQRVRPFILTTRP